MIDPAAMRVLGLIGVDSRPWYIALAENGRKLFVANDLSNSVSVIDTGSLRVVRTIPAGDGPWGIAVATHQPAP